MRVVIIHYHLNPGGVTRIIESQVKCLEEKKSFQVSVLVGSHSEKIIFKTKVNITVNPLLNYLEKDTDEKLLFSQYEEILTFLKNSIQKEDIIHVHNLNLGKNPLLLLAVNRLADEEYRIVNHCHDFPEDRPFNMAFLEKIFRVFKKDVTPVLYRQLNHYVYTVLNRADMQTLQRKGIKDENIVLLPNPVDISTLGSKGESREKMIVHLGLDPKKLIVTYPVRVIERKNIGEFIFLAVIFAQKANWCVTLPPENPVEKEEYEKWKNFCRENNINIVFDAGLQTNYTDLIAASDFCVTTSVREGFGMVYLEPWLLLTPVIGRNIGQVTGDLKEEGLRFRLYDRFIVRINDNRMDFKDLHAGMKMEIILDLIQNRLDKNKLMKDNLFLKDFLEPVPEEMIKSNRMIIQEKYSLRNYADRLERIYQKLDRL